MRPIQKGSTDQSVVIRIVDSGDGTPETGVEHNTSGIDLWYRREGAAQVSITEAALAALTTAHTDGGIEHIGDGYYRLDPPDAAFASGADGVMIGGTVTGMVVIGCYVPLVDYDPYDGTRLGITALPDAAADAAGGLPISDAGALDLDTLLGYLTAAVATAAELAKVPKSDSNVSWNATALAAINAEADTALSDYDAPTKAEMDSAFAALNDPTVAAIADAVLDELLSGHATAGTLGKAISDVLADTNELQSDDVPGLIAALNDVDSTAVQAACAAALVAIHLDHLLSADYDPSSKPGTATALLNELVENDSGVSRFTTNALEQGPTGSGGDATEAKQDVITAHLTDIKGAGWSSATDTLEKLAVAIAAISVGSGAGAFSVTLTIKETGGAALVPECDVILTTTSTSPSTNIYGTGKSDANADVTFQLDAGTYYIWRQKAGYNFAGNPLTLVVDAVGSATVS